MSFSIGDSSGADEEEHDVSEVIDLSESHVSEDILARWVVLDVGKGTLDSTFVNVEHTKAFRSKAYGAAGDCGCQLRALNLIHKASEVRDRIAPTTIVRPLTFCTSIWASSDISQGHRRRDEHLCHDDRDFHCNQPGSIRPGR
jgi:hypothetical protein